jgi:nitroreductase
VQSRLRFFLASAISPHVQSTGRWIGVDAGDRRAFAIHGKDDGSPLLRWLCAPEQGADASVRRAAAQIGADARLPSSGYLAWYRALNHGYPFFDYSVGSAREADAALMGAYAAADQPPPPATRRSGSPARLPPGRVAAAAAPSVDLLAGWLVVSGGITRLRDLSHSTIAFKTSPSGGARHPTDIAVTPGSAWPSSLGGSWWYDPLEHALVAVSPDDDPGITARGGPGSVVFTIASHVARAMWRYRDVRAFRPVVIDAGHVVETLMATIRSSGWRARWYMAPALVTVDDAFDAVVGHVVAWPPGEPEPVIERAASPIAEPDRDGGPLRTNPLLSLGIVDDGLVATDHLGRTTCVPVSGSQVDALAWATPSSRRDRPSTPSHLVEAVGISPAEVEDLVDAGLLLGVEAGDALWARSRLWSRHDWYLSLLAHVEEAAGPPVAVQEDPGVALPLERLGLALAGRRTHRDFTGAPLDDVVVERVLAVARSASAGVHVIALLRHAGAGLATGLHELTADGWVRTGLEPPTEDEVAAAAIGQPWARGFALCLWLLPAPDGTPGSWEGSLVECGRVAQRIALTVAADPAVGVFQSPALVDEVLHRLLGGRDALDGGYLIGLGPGRPGGTSSPSRFDPRQVLVGDDVAP